MPTAQATTATRFWRDPALPFLEARAIHDGRALCYGRHSHDSFSIGAITSGRSAYVNGARSELVGAGAIVVMNPGDAHACNPVRDERWGYLMMHVDAGWLGRLQDELADGTERGFRPFETTAAIAPALHARLLALHATLVDPDADTLRRHEAAIEAFATMQRTLARAQAPAETDHRKLERAADFIRAHCTRALALDEICAAARLSPSYLIRAFKRRFGMTPHAFLVDRRVEHARALLRRGHAIADAALASGFADQAHLQRSFKRAVAATPGEYRG